MRDTFTSFTDPLAGCRCTGPRWGTHKAEQVESSLMPRAALAQRCCNATLPDTSSHTASNVRRSGDSPVACTRQTGRAIARALSLQASQDCIFATVWFMPCRLQWLVRHGLLPNWHAPEPAQICNQLRSWLLLMGLHGSAHLGNKHYALERSLAKGCAVDSAWQGGSPELAA